MIRLAVEEYCHNCLEFEPKSSTSTLCADNSEKIVNTTVTCKHINRCRAIKRYLEKENKKDERFD